MNFHLNYCLTNQLNSIPYFLLYVYKVQVTGPDFLFQLFCSLISNNGQSSFLVVTTFVLLGRCIETDQQMVKEVYLITSNGNLKS